MHASDVEIHSQATTAYAVYNQKQVLFLIYETESLKKKLLEGPYRTYLSCTEASLRKS